MADREPMVGDEVEVTFRGRVRDLSESLLLVQTNHGAAKVSSLDASVEVLEPADDPSKDLLGTVRREDHEAGHSVWQCVIVPTNHNWRRWECVWSTAPGNIGSFLSHETVAASGFPVVGSVPGTPAADLEAERKLDEIPEWEQELLAQESARSREPRVFSSDGPEPPEGVFRVINRFGDTIERIGSRWWYTTQDGQPLDPPHDESTAWHWPSDLNDGPYTEAVS